MGPSVAMRELYLSSILTFLQFQVNTATPKLKTSTVTNDGQNMLIIGYRYLFIMIFFFIFMSFIIVIGIIYIILH